MTVDFCLESVKAAIAKYGKPMISATPLFGGFKREVAPLRRPKWKWGIFGMSRSPTYS